jgi:CheY-like chemotaxis protein
MSTTDLQGLSVFVVEDEALVFFLLEEILLDAGCSVIGPGMSLKKAAELAETRQDIDVAILDVNLAGKMVYPVAEILKRRGIPFAFTTGYGETGLSEEWRGAAVISKPWAEADMIAALTRLRHEITH